MAIESGHRDVVVAMLDGPVARSHPDLSTAHLRRVGADGFATAEGMTSPICQHGTFIAGVLCARPSSPTPGICPGCTVLVRPIFHLETASDPPLASGGELACALVEAVQAGARIINISAVVSPSVGPESELADALGFAVHRGSIVVAAAGGDHEVTSSTLTRHPGVVPVVACDATGRPTPSSNLSRSMGIRGIAAPGTLRGLATDGPPTVSSGTSVAAVVVAGTCALLWSTAPGVAAERVTFALRGAGRRTSVVPPRLNAWAAYMRLRGGAGGRASQPGRVPQGEGALR
ncbi:S8 family serine peptidase [Geodermatophilus sp. SYSU D00867]